jgi:hypothetical protein
MSIESIQPVESTEPRELLEPHEPNIPNTEPAASSPFKVQVESDLIDPTPYGISLADAVRAAMPNFVNRVITERLAACAKRQDTAAFSASLVGLGETMRASVDRALRAFLTSDVDTQRTTPLTIIRNHMAPVTELLQRVECAHSARDPFDVSAFPDDLFAIGPHAWADFGDEVHEAGLSWGAAKAMAHRQRHRSL